MVNYFLLKSVSQQLEDGKKFFARKYPDMKYLAYFQAFTNTYAPLDHLKRLYEEALTVDGIVGIVIGTRPDCVSEELLDYLEELSKRTFVLIEYGIESTDDETLRFVNRGHDFECSKRAIMATASRNILIGAHIILGFPDEDKEEIIKQAKEVSALPINILKLHQLQIIKGTKLAEIYKERPFHLYSADEYIQVVAEYIQRLRPSLVLERFVSQSPKELLVGPNWGLKNYEFTHLLDNYLKKNKIHQGDKLNED